MSQMTFIRGIRLACAASAGLAAACAAQTPDDAELDAPIAVASEALSSSLSNSRCEGLGRASIQNVTITMAAMIAADAVTPEGAAKPLPAHCVVQGQIDPHTGTDGKAYAIGFELRLPASGNGRFFFQGGGGTDKGAPPISMFTLFTVQSESLQRPRP